MINYGRKLSKTRIDINDTKYKTDDNNLVKTL